MAPQQRGFLFAANPKREGNKASGGLMENNEQTNHCGQWQKPGCPDTDNKAAAAQCAC